MPECVFAPIRLNLINDRKETGKEKGHIEGRKGEEQSERGGKHGAQCGATTVRSFFRKYHVTHRVFKKELDLTDKQLLGFAA